MTVQELEMKGKIVEDGRRHFRSGLKQMIRQNSSTHGGDQTLGPDLKIHRTWREGLHLAE